MGADDEGFYRAARVPKGKEAVGMVGRNHAEFIDAICVDQLLEILDGLAVLKLTDAGPKLLPGVLLQSF